MPVVSAKPTAASATPGMPHSYGLVGNWSGEIEDIDLDSLPPRPDGEGLLEQFRSSFSPHSAAAFFSNVHDTLALERLKGDWNHYGAEAPQVSSITSALAFLVFLYQHATSIGSRWTAANVTASAEGEVVLEWWRGEKKLTVYINDDSLEYIKSWGPDIEQDMEEGVIATRRDIMSLWVWLLV